MTESMAVCMALAVAFGAWSPVAMPIIVPVLVTVLAYVGKRPTVFIVALLLVSSAHSAREWHKLQAPLPKNVDADAVLLRDPEVSGHMSRVEIKTVGRHWELWSSDVRELHAAQRIHVRGVVRPLSGPRSSSLRNKHVAGMITATSVTELSTDGIANTLPNGFRALIERGARPLSDANEPLFTGLVYGDDRSQSEQSVRDFRDSGLAHLTAVSGANVAFVLLLLNPLFKKLRLAGRFVGGIIALLVFGALTRWEPSVVRAEAMAAVVLYASFLGRPISLIRSLSLASTALLLADPFLVRALGFQLSVLACVGMALFGNLFAARIPGADGFRRAIAYSAAAQLAVAPLQLAVFGTAPAVGLVTNVLADPVAGLVMMWGLPAGVLAGVLGGWPARIVQLPTSLMLDWIRIVASVGAAADHEPVLRWLVFIVPFLALYSWSRRTAVSREPSTLISDG